MPVPQQRDPWGEEPERPTQVGWLLWLVLALGLTGLIWLLATRFSYALGARDDWINLVRLVAILALVSSGVLFARRIHLRCPTRARRQQ